MYIRWWNIVDLLTGVQNWMPQNLGPSHRDWVFHPSDTDQVDIPLDCWKFLGYAIWTWSRTESRHDPSNWPWIAKYISSFWNIVTIIFIIADSHVGNSFEMSKDHINMIMKIFTKEYCYVSANTVFLWQQHWYRTGSGDLQNLGGNPDLRWHQFLLGLSSGLPDIMSSQGIVLALLSLSNETINDVIYDILAPFAYCTITTWQKIRVYLYLESISNTTNLREM